MSFVTSKLRNNTVELFHNTVDTPLYLLGLIDTDVIFRLMVIKNKSDYMPNTLNYAKTLLLSCRQIKQLSQITSKQCKLERCS